MASVPDWIVDAAEAVAPSSTIIPADEYFPSMAQVVVASDQTIKQKPELIRKLVQATLHGAQGHHRRSRGRGARLRQGGAAACGPRSADGAVFELYNKYVYPGQKVLGEIDPARLRRLAGLLCEGRHRREGDAGRELYTNEFVK